MELDLDPDPIDDPESEVFLDLIVRAPEYLLVAFARHPILYSEGRSPHFAGGYLALQGW